MLPFHRNECKSNEIKPVENRKKKLQKKYLC